MPPPPLPSSGSDSGGEGREKKSAAQMTSWFAVFFGNAMGIMKALDPKFFQPRKPKPSPPSISPTFSMKPADEKESTLGSGQSSARTVEIIEGDTLWGLSRKYGVSIEAIKEANGITGDTIYAGKKLIIP
ncbi:Peptidoglycan-binding lysin domain [Cocos nucifera]|uniref:Peptidoglycan-binding lysin domain n=1 Tax=Cocos nucifera TaxID=13894 RepID=A0A8K0HXR1_COCNU|nr:Peptidoglycan-binding lysin domain [Cocos nucifera]